MNIDEDIFIVGFFNFVGFECIEFGLYDFEGME